MNGLKSGWLAACGETKKGNRGRGGGSSFFLLFSFFIFSFCHWHKLVLLAGVEAFSGVSDHTYFVDGIFFFLDFFPFPFFLLSLLLLFLICVCLKRELDII